MPTKRRKRRITPVMRRFSHRTHPCKVYLPPPGICHWCHGEINKTAGKINANSKFCGRTCEEVHAIHTDPKVWRKEVWRKDRGLCQQCGKKHPVEGKDWEADHVLPLFISCGDWNFWAPENGAVLCKDPCHKNKTKLDRIRFGSAPKKTRRR